MALKFIISGTGPRSGKTMVGCALAFAFRVRGMRVGVMKPIATGCSRSDDGTPAPADAASLLAAAACDLPLDLVSPYRYISSLAPLEAARADRSRPPNYSAISRSLGEIERSSDVVLVEDAHGLPAPIDASHDFAALALDHQLELILVVASRPGFVAAACDALDFAARRGVAVRGVILNALDREASAGILRDADALANATVAAILGTVRFKEPLSLAIVERLL